MDVQHRRGYMLSVLARFTLYFGVTAVSVVLALASLEYHKFELKKSDSRHQESLRLSLASRILHADLRRSIDDTRTIAALEVLSDYVHDETAANRVRVENEFLNFVRNTRMYDQIRYIDSSGIERVRVNFDGHAGVPVPVSRLQDKSQRYYFREALRLNGNAIYISPLDLNVENGQIERPFKPMIRIATPVLDTAGRLRGVLVLNYLAAALLDDFREFMAGSWGEPMMVNPAGYWLSSLNRGDEWGFILGSDETFAKRHPKAWNYIVRHESGELETEAGLFIFQTLRPYAVSASRGAAPAEQRMAEPYWKIITRVSPQALIYSPTSVLATQPKALTGLLLLVGILSLALAWLRTNYVTKATALRESENQLAEAQRIAHLGNWVWDIPTGKVSWSDEIYRIFGREPGQFGATYEAFLAAVHSDDRKAVGDAVNAALRGEVPYEIDHRIVCPDGTERVVHERGEVMFDAAGNPVRMLGTVQDTTVRMRAEEVLRDSEERFRQLADNINEVFWLTEWPQNRVLYVSPAFERLWGISAEQLYQDPMTWVRAIAEEDRPSVEQTFLGSAGTGGFDITFRITRADGESRWIHDRAFVVRNEQGEVFRIAGVAQDITERKRFEQALRESEERLRALVQQASDGIFVADLDGRYTDVNEAGCKMLGYERDEIVGKAITDFIPSADLDRLLQSKEQMMKGGPHVGEWSLRRKDGTHLPVEVSAKILPDGRWQGFVRDISERKRAEEKRRQAATVFNSTMEAIIIADAERKIVAVNPAYTNITGFEPDEVLGKSPRLHQSGKHGEEFYQDMWTSLERSGQWQGEIWNRRKNGELYPAWQNISVVKDDQGQITNYVSVMSDISTIKEVEERLSHLAHHDALTGLPNRLLFTANLDQALERAKRHQQKVALLFLDLDHFKRINDTLGHATGDQLLQAVSARLKRCVRAEDTVARLGGDEFTIVLDEITHAEDAALLAEKAINAIAQPVDVDGREIVTSTSIGISIYPDDGQTSEQLTRAADVAMYRAKERGRHTYEFYTAELTEKALEYFSVENALRQALARNEFMLYYQPQLELSSGKIVGVEALIRWQHPQRGLIAPDAFIPVAEDTGLIRPIGEWVLLEACAQAAVWRKEGLRPLRIAVNLSGRQLVDVSLIDTVRKALDEAGLRAADLALELEVTESVLHAAEQSIEILRGLQSLGVKIAIDDFGTGYSSLSHLKHLPIDTLKIDRMFVRDIPDDPDDQAIAAAIISLGHSLRLNIVAEGVENPAQLGFLQTLGCDQVQGYLFSEPVPPDQIRRLVEGGPLQASY